MTASVQLHGRHRSLSRGRRHLAADFGWEITQDFGAFAEVHTGGGPALMLNVPSIETTEIQAGVVLHCPVDDVSAATERARAAGATILREPARMDFGMESAYAQVDGGPVVDLTRPL